MGGTPNPGTPKDKRLKDNKPDAKKPVSTTIPGAQKVDFSKFKKS